MTKAQLDSKPLAELHALAADAEIPRYRMLARAELIEKLLEEGPKPKGDRGQAGRREGGGRGRQRRPAQRGGGGGRQGQGGEGRGSRQAEPRQADTRSASSRPAEPRPAEPRPAEAGPAEPRRAADESEAAGRPRRRRRRWRRRGKKVRVADLLLPAAPGRQTILHAETREACTAALRQVAAELSSASKGPDPIALLIDPSPEELADWRREAPRAEIVAAGQAHHADDAVAQAVRRADGGEDVILLIDSVSRFAESFGDADTARELFDAGRRAGREGNGSLTVVAAVDQS
jgi:hypothetical protein